MLSFQRTHFLNKIICNCQRAFFENLMVLVCIYLYSSFFKKKTGRKERRKKEEKVGQARPKARLIAKIGDVNKCV